MRKTRQILVSVAFGALLCNCNIEVGNPDSQLPEGMRSAQTLTFQLSAQSRCETTTASCTSVPVISGDLQQPPISYELTSVNFQLAGVTLKPSAEQDIWTQLDLLAGGSIAVSESTDLRSVSGLSLRFANVGVSGAQTFEFKGNLIISNDGQRLVVPLTLQYRDPVLAETTVDSPGNIIMGVVFDPAVWFNFSDARGEIGQILQGISNGACREQYTASCVKHREILARQVSARISRSMSLKTSPGPKSQNNRMSNDR